MKYSDTTKSERGTMIRTDFGRDRSDEMPKNMQEAKFGRLKGSTDNISPMISGGKAAKAPSGMGSDSDGDE
jgi:hypothetical protein